MMNSSNTTVVATTLKYSKCYIPQWESLVRGKLGNFDASSVIHQIKLVFTITYVYTLWLIYSFAKCLKNVNSPPNSPSNYTVHSLLAQIHQVDPH